MNLVKPESINSTGSITRSTIGTYFDSTGVMRTAAIDAVRIDHNPYTKEFRGVLFENASTNRILYSEDLTSTLYNKYYTTFTVEAAVAPDGTTTFDGVIASAINDEHLVEQEIPSLTTGSAYTYSLYVKKGAADKIRLRIYGRDAPSGYSGEFIGFTFNFLTKSITNITLNTATGSIVECNYEQISADVYRIWITGIPTSTTDTALFRVSLVQNNTDADVYLGDGTTIQVYVWGWQVELGNISSYIKTTAAAVTRAADIIIGSGLVYTNVTNTYAEWSSGTTYALGTSVSYGISGTYISLQNSNLNQNPLTATTYWSRTGPTNKMAAFDDQVSSATTSSSDIIFAVTAGSIDTVALLNVIASKTSVAVSDTSVRSLIYHNSQQLTGGESLDWFGYFFYDTDTVRNTSVYMDVPVLSNALITVKISGTGTVSIGTFVTGEMKVLGNTQYGVSAGIIDYSRKDIDEFGNVSFVKRNFSKRINASVSLTNANLNKVQRILYQLRATPVLWLASTDIQFEEPLIIYGFYRDFSTEISYPTHSLCNLQIEGLI
jgi:hypothetical protein